MTDRPSSAPPHVPIDKPPRLDELVRDLHRTLRTGLPVTPALDVPALLNLRGVWARAVDPTDPLARVDALDRLIRAQLKKTTLSNLDRPAIAHAALRLFGAAGSRGRDLTHRRVDAAGELGYDADHFRKRIEPRIVEQLAWQLHQDSLQYTPRARRYPPPEASGDTPVISEEDIADPEQANHQILLSRIWSEVYGLRADLITQEVLRVNGEDNAAFTEAKEAAELRLGKLLDYLDEYLAQYGERILHGEAEYNAEALVRLAGWKGALSEQDAREIRWKARRHAARAIMVTIPDKE